MNEVVQGALQAHLELGATTTCRCWKVVRNDGVGFGFTDHDRKLSFEDFSFEPVAGFDARMLQSGQGLKVDNSEVVGVLNSDRISESDLSEGKFDAAEVFIWHVNWADTNARQLIFRGNFGEVTFDQNQFTVELRSLTDRLSKPIGRHYLKQCDALLGDARCKFDPEGPNYLREVTVKRVDGHKLLYLEGELDLPDDWFAYGSVEALDGPNQGRVIRVHSDRIVHSERRIELAEDFFHQPMAGASLRMIAGCDKQHETCKSKFQNVENFQGFPFMPGEDWLLAYPNPK